MRFVTSRLPRMELAKSTQQQLRRIPGLLALYRILRFSYSLCRTGNFRFVYPYTPGDYYSPLPDRDEVLKRSRVLFERDVAGLPGIALREEAQLELLDSFADYYHDLPFPVQPGEATRYYYENDYFTYADAITLYSVLRHFEPRNVIEVGSGFSSAVMLDVNDIFLENSARFTFVEPYPERLFTLLTGEDSANHTVLQDKIQDVPLETFDDLSANDVLFVDSSHIVKVGSDVAHILFNILPRLKPGVLIHVHDIFWPFEYPEEWVLSGRAWNEAYFLRSFLQFNEAFEILYFSSFLWERHVDALREKLPLCLNQGRWGPSSLWLKKVP